MVTIFKLLILLFPVLVTGLEAVPDAGDPFDVIRDEKEARNISQHRKEYQRIGQASTVIKVTLDNMNEIISQVTQRTQDYY